MDVSYDNSEINIRELFSVLWAGRKVLLGTMFISSIIAASIAFTLPNIYKSEVLLSPVSDEQSKGMGGLAGQLGGIASLAGVNLGAGSADKTVLALEVLQSRSFLIEFIERNNLKLPIFAIESWKRKENKLQFDSDIYDIKSQRWVREVSLPKTAEPSSYEVYKEFKDNNLEINHDKETGFVKISISHQSPFFAKQQAERLVKAINDKMKHEDIEESVKSISYLHDALNKTVVADMQKVFYQLIEQQEQKRMLASIRDDYVLKVIDPAIVPEEPSGPKRIYIIALGLFLGLVLPSFILLVRSSWSKNKR